MNAARWILGLSTSFAVCASIATGCSSSSPSNAPIDSGSGEDVTTEAAVEAAVEAAPEAAPVVEAGPSDAACVPDANINSLPVPDASLGDAGATAASCLSCFESSCGTIVSECNASCACVSAFQQFETCLGSGQGLTTCGVAFAGASGAGITPTQLFCAAGCASQAICGVTFTLPGGDSGTGGDSATTGDAAGE